MGPAPGPGRDLLPGPRRDRLAGPAVNFPPHRTLRATVTVPTASSGYDGGKKINGRKRHVAVDTGGLLLAVVVTTASVQDRDGAFRSR